MKLYVIARADLGIEHQAVQALHALREFVEHCPDEDRRWYRESNTIALITVPNEERLHQLLNQAEDRGIPHAGFREPDLNNSLTAGVIGPAGKKLCRNLPLLRPFGDAPQKGLLPRNAEEEVESQELFRGGDGPIVDAIGPVLIEVEQGAT